MSHPCRRAKRAVKKKAKEKMLPRRTFDYLDLTPYNTVGQLKFKEEFAIKYK